MNYSESTSPVAAAETPCLQSAASPPSMTPLPVVPGGRYEVLEQVGKGAFGEVYKARDSLLDRTVAIKRIRLDWLADRSRAKEVVARFHREAQIAAQLQHPNIVTIYDVVSVHETSYIVMEFVEGTTLAGKLAGTRVIPLEETVHILTRVAKALQHAHENKVVHRDIKPANVLLSKKGDVKVTDFGAAKIESPQSLTVAGAILGTPHYMSPEQASGGTVDNRSDLFSLGSILYECLTGDSPFNAPNLTGVLIRIVNDTPAPLETVQRGLPPEVQDLLNRSLNKDSSQRIATARDFARELEALPKASSSALLSADNDLAVGDDASERDSLHRPPPDSVADVLMKEARSTTRIQPHLLAFKEESRRLELTGSPLLQFRNVALTPEEAYLLSRIEEKAAPRDILAVSPLTESETARTILGFLRTGLVTFTEHDESPEQNVQGSSSVPQSDDLSKQVRELERVYRQMRGADHWQVLGVTEGAASSEVKRAFQKQAFRFHPDRFSGIASTELQKKVSWLFSRVSEAFAAVSVS